MTDRQPGRVAVVTGGALHAEGFTRAVLDVDGGWTALQRRQSACSTAAPRTRPAARSAKARSASASG